MPSINWRFWRRRNDADFHEEIQAHLALEAERLVAQRGLPPRDAIDVARRNFGNVMHAEERFHESARWLWLERWAQHLRHALRAMRRQPAFSLAAILTLGLGIGFNTAIFSVFYALGYRELPVRDADRLVNVYHRLEGSSRPVHGFAEMVSWQDYEAYDQALRAAGTRDNRIASAAVYASVPLTFTSSRATAADGELVSCTYFATIGVRLAHGRGFVDDECARRGAPAVAVVSYAFWNRELGGDVGAMGRTVRINQVPFTVIGVTEPGFAGLNLRQTDVWIPATMQMAMSGHNHSDSLLVRDWSWMVMIARLAPGARIADARAQLAVTTRQRDALVPGRTTRVIVTKGAFFNFPQARDRATIVIAMVSVLGALVVVMICANLMNLLLARGLARRREIGIRLAIGASRRRLVEQLLVESGVLAVLGGVLGLGLAVLLLSLVPKLIPVPLQMDLSPDGRVLAFTALVSLATAMVFGLVPAWRATRVDLVSAFKGGGVATGARTEMHPSRLRNVVVGVQVAGSAVLLIIAALLVRAAQHGSTLDVGYTTEGVVAFELNLPMLGYSEERARAAYDALLQRLAATPGVRSVSLASPLPLLGRRSEMVRETGASDDAVINTTLAVTSGTWFTTLEIPIVAGRAFTDADVAAAGVAGEQPLVISQALATMLARDASPLGKQLTMNGRNYRVVGVAANARTTSLSSAEIPFMYVPAHPGRDRELHVVARVAGALAPIERLMPQLASALDPSIVVKSQRLSDRLALELMPARYSSAIAGTMGALTLLLALVGIYGVVTFAVAQRTRDIAVRRALGATDRNVVQLMMRQGSRSVVIGLAAGALIALGASQLLRGVLLGVNPLDALSFGLAIVALLATAGAAIYVPARRAARVDPARTLRED